MVVNDPLQPVCAWQVRSAAAAVLLYVQQPLVNQRVDHRAGHGVPFELPLCFVEIHAAAISQFGDKFAFDETLHGFWLIATARVRQSSNLCQTRRFQRFTFLTAAVAGSQQGPSLQFDYSA